MKKLFLLAGVAAAAFGAMKLLRGGEKDEFGNIEPYAPSAYHPEPQP